MRELKFRAWDGKKMCYDPDNCYLWNGILVPPADDIIMQYTGLHDKNGVEIYDGDVVHYSYHPGTGFWNNEQDAIIEWNTTGFFFHGIPHGFQGWLCSLPGGFEPGCRKLFEVIGNIHESPELLEAT